MSKYVGNSEQMLAGMKLRYEWPSAEDFYREFLKPPADGRPEMPAGKRKVILSTIRKCRLGWADDEMKDQLRKFHDLYAYLKAVVTSRIPRPVMRPKVVGSRANIGGILTGDPRCALGRDRSKDASRRRGQSNLIKVCVNVDAFGGCGADYFFIRGAAMCALIEALEAAKFRVEVSIAIASMPMYKPQDSITTHPDGTKVLNVHWMSDYNWLGGSIAYGEKESMEYSRKNNQRYVIKVKPASLSVAPLQLAYLLMHPSTLRILFFNFWAYRLPVNTGEYERYYHGTVGCVGVVPEFERCKDAKHNPNPEADIYVKGYESGNPAAAYGDKAGAAKWILAELKKFGVDIK